jgi:DNA-binding beta-propeller fold protein YncE
VADHDETLGNYYHINLTTGARTYLNTGTTIYSFARDNESRRIFGASRFTGLHVLDIATEAVTVIPYGSDVDFSRMLVFVVSDMVLALDDDDDTITRVDKNTLNVIETKIISSGIPSGSTFFESSFFTILDVDGQAWVLANKRASGNIGVYTPDLNTLITNFAIPGVLVDEDSKYTQYGFYDNTTGRVYIHDNGSGKTFVIDKATYTVISTFSWPFISTIEEVRIRFLVDPVTASLYFDYRRIELSSGAQVESRVYVIKRSDSSILRVYLDVDMDGESATTGTRLNIPVLEREGATDIMWLAWPGFKSWEGEPGWATDGRIKKYTHGS